MTGHGDETVGSVVIPDDDLVPVGRTDGIMRGLRQSQPNRLDSFRLAVVDGEYLDFRRWRIAGDLDLVQ